MNQSDKNCLTTVDQVVNEIIDELTLAERVSAADLEENEFLFL
jgi:hypothetical protein